MRVFRCAHCAQVVFFENTRCTRCGAELGFDPESLELRTLEPEGNGLRSLTDPSDSRRWRFCANHVLAACNWLVALEGSALCRSCRVTRVRPPDGDPEGLAAFARAERAKRRLVWQVLGLGLPLAPRDEDPGGIAFELLWSPQGGIVTGHQDGVITVDLRESDDVRRERLRIELDEPYRTLLGHFRHEIGHYYWSLLVAGPAVGWFRALFGDERSDYAGAMDRHYQQGPTSGWESSYVSAYASMHPFEDWAESFAHYLHMRDVLEMAASFRMTLAGPPGGSAGSQLSADPGAAVAHPDFDGLLEAWIPLGIALNAVNRAMGKEDLYPFVLAPQVTEKLRFVHDRVVAWGGGSA